jgi:hypothetical protein
VEKESARRASEPWRRNEPGRYARDPWAPLNASAEGPRTPWEGPHPRGCGGPLWSNSEGDERSREVEAEEIKPSSAAAFDTECLEGRPCGKASEAIAEPIARYVRTRRSLKTRETPGEDPRCPRGLREAATVLELRRGNGVALAIARANLGTDIGPRGLLEGLSTVRIGTPGAAMPPAPEAKR